MKRELIYRIVIGVLAVLVIGQWMAISRKKVPERTVKFVRPAPAPVTTPSQVKGRIAIVIDDWGYHADTVATAKELKIPLTAAVLPNLDYSGIVSSKLAEADIEVILHLPMQPYENLKLEKDTILTNMNAAQINKIMDAALKNIGYAKGVSNHMGSRVTDDAKTMQAIFTVLKKRGLYFLDSFVTPNSVCRRLALSEGIPFVRRDVFLDNSQEPSYIKKQLTLLKNKAAQRGFAIGIGHDRRKTFQVLKEMIPVLKKEGFKFVYLSELVE